MRTAVLLALTASLVSCTVPEGFTSHGGCSWVASDETVEKLSKIVTPEPFTYLGVSDLPEGVDWRTANNTPINNLCTRVMTQMQPRACGSCWAMATTGAMSDRFQVAAWTQSGGRVKANTANLAPQVLLDCGMETANGGGLIAGDCYGGSAFLGYKWIHDFGITDESCAPYIASSPSYWAEVPCHTRMCHKCNRFGVCEVLQNPPIYKAAEYGAITPSRAKAANTTMVHMMATEIFARGPITCSIYAHADAFENYTSGIITDKTKYPGTTHDIVLLGFGIDHGVNYWIGRNSYGTWWGVQGYFYIEKGADTLNIESNCAWGVPAGTGPSRQ